MTVTIEAVHRKVQYTSTGSLGPSSFSFKFLSAADIKVSVHTTAMAPGPSHLPAATHPLLTV